MTVIEFVVLMLAVWRTSSLFANEGGPLDVFFRLRTRLGVEFDDAGRYGTNMLSKLVICIWCLSVWFGMIVAALFYVAPRGTFFVCLPLAISAATIIVEETISAMVE